MTTVDGRVVVGLQFYKKGNRLALEMTQAELDKAGDINASSQQKRRNDEWGEDVIQIGANSENQLMTTIVPTLCMVTGVQLWLEGNKLMVLLEYVPFDVTTQTADFKKRAWTRAADATDSSAKAKWISSDPDGKVAPDSHRGRVGLQYNVLPNPLSPITGVMLDFNPGAGGGFMCVRGTTDFYGPDKATPKTA